MRHYLPYQLAAVAIAGFVAAASTHGQQVPVAPSGFFPPLEAYLESLRQQAGIPGMSAAVVQDGAIVWEHGFGFQDLGANVRATPDTPYLVGDVSETLAAVLLLQCVEQRRLDLDDPLGRHVPGFPYPDATLRRMLSHTSGDSSGEVFNYSPGRYAHLTSVMEWCAPQPYRKSVAHRLLNRLAMRDSVPGTDLLDPNLDLQGLFDNSDVDRYRAVLHRMAVPYQVDGRGRAERTALPPTAVTAANGLVSTVRDLARLDAALNSAVLLRDETLAVAWSPVGASRGTPLPTGLGWFVQTHRAERLVWHFGLVPYAYSSLVLKVPGRRLTFILLANSDGLSAPFQLGSGDVTRSLFATLFLRLAT